MSLLNDLLEYSKTIDIPTIGFANSVTNWLIHLDEDSHYIEPLETPDPKGKKKAKPGKVLKLPYIRRNGVAAQIVSDTAEYIYEGGRHGYRQAYLELLQECWDFTEHPSIQKVLDYCYQNPELPEGVSPKDRIAFWDDDGDCLLTDIPEIATWWSKRCEPSDVPLGQCMVTGETRRIAQKQSVQLKGIPGGQSTGSSLISSYCKAFQSYGRSQAAPMGVSVDNDIHQALAALLSDKSRCLRIESLAIVTWGSALTVDSLQDAEACQAFLKTPFSPSTIKDPPKVHLLTLKGNGGRASVRDYVTFPESVIRYHLTNWIETQEVPGFGEFDNRKHQNIYGLARAAFRTDEKILPRVTQSLIANALFGNEIPFQLAQLACTRTRIEQRITWPRAVLYNLITKLYRNGKMERELTPQQAIAFHFGRLLALHARAQVAAQPGRKLPETNAAQAMAVAGVTPAAMAHRLTSTSQIYLMTMARSAPGRSVLFERRFGEIHTTIAALGTIPKTFSLEAQVYFDQGYWQELGDWSWLKKKDEEVSEVA